MGTTLHWDQAGDGAPLVLLHGIGSTLDDFAALRGRLESSYAVLAADLPGHGGSPALLVPPTVEAITDVVESDLDTLGLERVHILGNSLGARVALALARRHRARSVVSIAPSGMNGPTERVYQGTVMATARVVLRAARNWIEPLSRSRIGRMALLTGLRARPGRASRDEGLAVRDGFADSEDFWRMLWHAILTDVPTGLEDVDCPVVLAQGLLDAISAGQTPRYLLAVPGARFVPLPVAGHAPQSDTPDAIVRLVHEAARRATAPSAGGTPCS
ncbi:MAG TPA: alpha/beta fold hydrolase [Actinomycetospora sp.]|nr:alpha/beta fold hydrolase [Actinomycetospora sp.]